MVERKGDGEMIHIIDDMYLDADQNQYLLKLWDGKYTTNKGRPYPQIVRTMYFSDFEALLKKVHTLMARKSIEKVETLEELKEEFIEIRKKLTEVANKIDVPTLR